MALSRYLGSIQLTGSPGALVVVDRGDGACYLYDLMSDRE